LPSVSRSEHGCRHLVISAGGGDQLGAHLTALHSLYRQWLDLLGGVDSTPPVTGLRNVSRTGYAPPSNGTLPIPMWINQGDRNSKGRLADRLLYCGSSTITFVPRSTAPPASVSGLDCVTWLQLRGAPKPLDPTLLQELAGCLPQLAADLHQYLMQHPATPAPHKDPTVYMHAVIRKFLGVGTQEEVAATLEVNRVELFREVLRKHLTMEGVHSKFSDLAAARQKGATAHGYIGSKRELYYAKYQLIRLVNSALPALVPTFDVLDMVGEEWSWLTAGVVRGKKFWVWRQQDWPDWLLARITAVGLVQSGR